LSSDHTLFFTAVISEFSCECSITVMTGRDNNMIMGEKNEQTSQWNGNKQMDLL